MSQTDLRRAESSRKTLYATDFPANDLPQIIDRLKAANGVDYDCAILGWEACQLLLAEIDRLKVMSARAEQKNPTHWRGDCCEFG